jgi:hypothetical protein
MVHVAAVAWVGANGPVSRRIFSFVRRRNILEDPEMSAVGSLSSARIPDEIRVGG